MLWLHFSESSLALPSFIGDTCKGWSQADKRAKGGNLLHCSKSKVYKEAFITQNNPFYPLHSFLLPTQPFPSPPCFSPFLSSALLSPSPPFLSSLLLFFFPYLSSPLLLSPLYLSSLLFDSLSLYSAKFSLHSWTSNNCQGDCQGDGFIHLHSQSVRHYSMLYGLRNLSPALGNTCWQCFSISGLD